MIAQRDRREQRGGDPFISARSKNYSHARIRATGKKKSHPLAALVVSLCKK